MKRHCIRESQDYSFEEDQEFYPDEDFMMEVKPQMPNKFRLQQQLMYIINQMEICLIGTFMLSQVLMYLSPYCKQVDSKRFDAKIQQTVGLVKNGVLTLKELTSALIDTIIKVKEIKDFTFVDSNHKGFSKNLNQAQKKIKAQFSPQNEFQYAIKLCLIKKPTFELFTEYLQFYLQEIFKESNLFICLSPIKEIKCPIQQCKSQLTFNDLETFLDHDTMEKYYTNCPHGRCKELNKMF